MKKIIYALIVGSLISGCDSEPSSEEYVKSGQEYVAQKEWKSAIIEFKNAVKKSPDDALARAVLGKTYLETQSYNAAIKELTRALELGHSKSELMIPLGLAYRQVGENQKVIDEIKPQAGQSDTDKAVIEALRGSAYLFSGDRTAAKSSLEKARSLGGEETQVRLAWAIFESANGNIEAQERWLLPLLERDGGVAEAWSQVGAIEQGRGNPDAAEKAYSRAIDIRGTPHFDNVRRALLRVTLDNVSGAESDIEFLRKAGANWPMLGHAEGLIDFRAKNYTDAQAHFVEVLSRMPDYPPSQLMAGLSYFYQQNHSSAVTYLEQYFGNNPGNDQAKQIYANALLSSGNVDKSVSVLEELNSANPNDFRTLAMLGEAYLRQGKNLESLEVIKQAVQIKPDLASTRLQLGSSLIRNPETASIGQQELRKALELDPGLRQAKLSLFMSYLREKQYAPALETAREIDTANPTESTGANLVALAYLAQGKADEAKQQLTDTLKRFPVDVATSHTLARIHIQEKSYDQARKLYLAIIEKTPEHMLSLQQLALIAAREGKPGDMMQWLKKAVERNPKETRPKLLLASQYLQQGDADEATRVLNDVDVEDKENPGFMLLMARAKLGSGENDHALRLLKSLESRQPEMAAAHFFMAQAYAQQGNTSRMRESLERTVEIYPPHLSSQLALARLELAEGNGTAFDARIAELETMHPGNTDVEILKARKSSINKDYGTAIKSLSELLADSPQSDVVIELSRNQFQSGDRQGAISSLELWSQTNADDRVLLQLAEYYLLENRFDEATSTYLELGKKYPENSRILNNLAWSLKDSNPTQGIEYARKAIEVDPENPYVMDTLAMLLLETGEKQQALELIEQAAKKAPRVADIQFNLSEVLIANDQKDRARKVLETLLIGTQEETKRQLIRERLKNL